MRRTSRRRRSPRQAPRRCPSCNLDDDLEIYDYPGDYDAPGAGSSIARIRLEQIQASRKSTNVPPYALPAEKTKSTLKSNSATGGGGFNELRFEDKKGSGEVFLHGQKDWNIAIEHDKKQWIGNDEALEVVHDRSKVVGNDQSEQIGGNKSIEVAKNHTERGRSGSRGRSST